jgi:hypothetical protein
MNAVTEIILAALPGLLVAIIGTLLSVNLALRRFYSEKWWERKADAYSRIVEELYQVVNSLDTYLTYFEQDKIISEEKKNELQQSSNEAYKEIYKAECIGAFIISDDVAQALSDMRNNEKNIPTDDSIYGILEARSKIVSKCLIRVKELAKKELRYRS